MCLHVYVFVCVCVCVCLSLCDPSGRVSLFKELIRSFVPWSPETQTSPEAKACVVLQVFKYVCCCKKATNSKHIFNLSVQKIYTITKVSRLAHKISVTKSVSDQKWNMVTICYSGHSCPYCWCVKMFNTPHCKSTQQLCLDQHLSAIRPQSQSMFSKTDWGHARCMRVCWCVGVLLCPPYSIKDFGGRHKAPLLAQRDRNWLPLQLLLPHPKRGSGGLFSVKMDREGGKWQDGRGKGKCKECRHSWK